MTDYDFTTDWTENFRRVAGRHLVPLKNQPLNYLEVGVFEGRSACWMLDNVLTHRESRYYGVDIAIQSRAWDNLKRHESKTILYTGDSRVVLRSLSPIFDVIYIDGDHSSRGCLFDSVFCWMLAKVGALLFWDDYDRTGSGNRVAFAVDRFLECIPKKEYRILESSEILVVEKRK